MSCWFIETGPAQQPAFSPEEGKFEGTIEVRSSRKASQSEAGDNVREIAPKSGRGVPQNWQTTVFTRSRGGLCGPAKVSPMVLWSPVGFRRINWPPMHRVLWRETQPAAQEKFKELLGGMILAESQPSVVLFFVTAVRVPAAIVRIKVFRTLQVNQRLEAIRETLFRKKG